MKANLYDNSGKKVKEISLPAQFDEAYRPDLIKKAVIAIQNNNRQPYGADVRAGLRHNAKVSRRRRDYKTGYGKGISHIPRKTMTRRGIQFFWMGAETPSAVGGRRAHPPKAAKIWDQKVNQQEKQKAIRSALAASANLEIVKARGHQTSAAPFIIDAKIETMKKAKDLHKVLEALGLKDELARVGVRAVRAGKGKARDRRYKTKTGPLIILSGNCDLRKSARNIPGIETISVKDLNAEILAPGTNAGRLCIWSESALAKLEKEKLFMRKTQ